MNVSWLSAGNGLSNAGIIITCAVIILTLLAFMITYGVFYYRRHSKKAMRKENHRISVRNVIAVDDSRRLVLIRRDHKEHLLLTGGNCDLLIESFPEAAANQTATDRSLFSFREPEAQNTRKLEAGIEVTNPSENAYIANQRHLSEPNIDRAENRRHNTTEPRRATSSAEPQTRGHSVVSPEYSRSASRQKQNDASMAENKIEKSNATPAGKKESNTYPELHSKSGAVSSEQSNNNHRESKIARNQTLQVAEDNQLNIKEGTNTPKLNGENVRQSQTAQQGQNGQGDAPHFGKIKEDRQNSVYPHDTYQPGHSQAADSMAHRQMTIPAERPPVIANNRAGTEIPPHSSAGGIYAPYLGYMPKATFRPRQSEMQKNNDSTNRGQNNHIDDNNRHTPPSFPQKTNRQQHSPNTAFSSSVQGENIPDQQPKQRERNYLPQDGRHGGEQLRNTAKSTADISRMVQPSFNRERTPKNSDNSPAKPQNSRQNFHRIVTPADDNDFDKILQDELLRAPNAIKLSPLQKK